MENEQRLKEYSKTRQLLNALSGANTSRIQAEEAHNMTSERKVMFLLEAIKNVTLEETDRQTATVLLGRLCAAEFMEFYPKLPSEKQQKLKEQLIIVLQQDEQSPNIRRELCKVIAGIAQYLIDQEGTDNWPEFLQFLWGCTESGSEVQQQNLLSIFTFVPGFLGREEANHLDLIKEIMEQSLMDGGDYEVQFQAVQAVSAFITMHTKEVAIQQHFSDLLPYLIKVTEESIKKQHDDTLMKSLINLAESAPKFLTPHIEYIPMLIPSVLKLMTELEDNAQWTTSDETADEDKYSYVIFRQRMLDRLIYILGGMMKPYIEQDIFPMLANPDWRYRHAALMALSSFGKGCKMEMEAVLPQIMDHILSFLDVTLAGKENKLVQEQVITTIISIADASNTQLLMYYDLLMPRLKHIIQNATTDDLRLLRANAIYCVCSIGFAVGAERFMHDAGEVVNILLRIQTESNAEDNDPQTAHIIAAWARICKILGKKFEQYLPLVMEPLMKAASSVKPVRPKVSLLHKKKMEDVDMQFVLLGQQNAVNETSGLENNVLACQVLVCYARDLKEGFAEYAEEVAKLMVPMLSLNFDDDIRIAAAEILPYLLDCIKIKGQQNLQRMWNNICPELLKACDVEEDNEVLSQHMHSLAKCIDTIGTACLTDEAMNERIRILEDKLMKEHCAKAATWPEKCKGEDNDEAKQLSIPEVREPVESRATEDPTPLSEDDEL